MFYYTFKNLLMCFCEWKPQRIKAKAYWRVILKKMWKRKPSRDMKVKLEEIQERIRHWWKKDSKDRRKGENEQNGNQEKVLNVRENDS